MIRLFVIEDHITVIVSSLRFLFRPQRDGIMVNGFAATVEEAINIADLETFDLFILDLYIPGHQPIENIRKLKAHFPGKPIAIYTSETSPAWRKRIIDEGALAYITKDAKRDELKLAILKSAKGELFYSGQTKLTEQPIPEIGTLSDSFNLTPVQTEIVRLLSEGLIHKEISDRINLSRSQVEKILTDLRKSLQVRNNVELIHLLTQKGSL